MSPAAASEIGLARSADPETDAVTRSGTASERSGKKTLFRPMSHVPSSPRERLPSVSFRPAAVTCGEANATRRFAAAVSASVRDPSTLSPDSKDQRPSVVPAVALSDAR
jgi:hypothetical protein